ncbi:3-dehydroquinate synthase [Subtercola boreus]|uniref:3-dehydroquinate synthase n=1 Tax=Subtercola boreus TaxID=120213 RepID=A0A3E0WEG1_9MICO|nr:3-dehydroquinate synthase [Subtercola boreus]RFA21310.1 3-dehydroquinate synthase [Subtercola boreus]RFA21693.1 3-dehydroquinate synthase [Subtercola boreus]RFA27662.1 3-dehydroquinate synthase [Subtercola boreus]
MNTDTPTVIAVPGTEPYDVIVGRGVLSNLRASFTPGVRKVLIVHAPQLADWAASLRTELRDEFEVLLAEVPDGEAAKRVEVASFLWQILGQADFTRTDAIVGFGGGATTDLAGFVAATWLRGVQLVQVPTTLLGMVDAAVGGKTGINTAEGKNLVGAFYAPRAVVADLDTLVSLPRNDLLAGFAEVVKAGFIAEPEILAHLEADVAVATDPGTPQFRRLVELSIGLKARVVGEDFRESGLREILNYGHTLGHAIEHTERYQWRHGAAVAVGMVFAAELGRLTGSLSDAAVDRHRSILESLGLPTTYPVGRWNTLLAAMQRDKKARGSMLRFIVLDDVAKPTVLQGPETSLLFAAYQEIGS